MQAHREGHRHAVPARKAVWFSVLCLLALVCAAGTAVAAPSAPAVPPVLIVDAGLGDARYFESHWLGEDALQVADTPGARLLVSTKPRWTDSVPTPATYLLAGSLAASDSPPAVLSVKQIAWALDTIGEREGDARSVVVAQGAAGILVREYVVDLAVPSQSSRADVVGLVLLGTPSNGFGLQKEFHRLGLWSEVAARAGMTDADLTPKSARLTRLNGMRLPAVVRTLIVAGFAFSAADADMDGLATTADTSLVAGVAGASADLVRVNAKASQTWPLQAAWLAASDRMGEVDEGNVPAAEVERIAPTPAYSVSPQAMQAVEKFYMGWFALGAPVTHVSSRLVLDTSGSMNQRLGARTKLAAAKFAARDFVEALRGRQGVEGAVPEDTALISFNEDASLRTSVGGDTDRVLSAVSGLRAVGNTDIGAALRLAVASFDRSPETAERVLVLLSDGVSTSGASQGAILRGPVAAAARRGIRVHAIALGSRSESNRGFLKEVAARTGGSYHVANDTFELRRDFLRARFSALGTVTVDSVVSLAESDTVPITTTNGRLRRVEIGVIPDGSSPTWQLVRDGAEVETLAVTVVRTKDGVSYYTVPSPTAGSYALRLVKSNGTRRVHVFAVTQVDPFRAVNNRPPDDSTAMMLVAATGLACVLGVGITAGVSRRKGDGVVAAAGEVEGRSQSESDGGEAH